MWKQWEHWPHTRGQSSPGTLPAGGGESITPVTQGGDKPTGGQGPGPEDVRRLHQPTAARGLVSTASHTLFQKRWNAGV